MENKPVDNNNRSAGAIQEMLADSGYSEKAIRYYLEKPAMGSLAVADQVSEMTGSCGDTMKVYLKVDQDIITDIKYQVLGCPGAVASAMAAAELVKGRPIDYARHINDHDIFKTLENLPDQKHHCIQLAVKALHKSIDDYRQNGGSSTKSSGEGRWLNK